MIVENIVKAIVLMAKVKHTCFFSILCLVTHPPPKIIGHISFKFSGILWSKYNLNSSLEEWKCANWCFSADVNVNPAPMLQMCKNQLAPLYLVTVYILSVYIFLQILDFQSDHFQFLPLYPGILGGGDGGGYWVYFGADLLYLSHFYQFLPLWSLKSASSGLEVSSMATVTLLAKEPQPKKGAELCW